MPARRFTALVALIQSFVLTQRVQNERIDAKQLEGVGGFSVRFCLISACLVNALEKENPIGDASGTELCCRAALQVRAAFCRSG